MIIKSRYGIFVDFFKILDKNHKICRIFDHYYQIFNKILKITIDKSKIDVIIIGNMNISMGVKPLHI